MVFQWVTLKASEKVGGFNKNLEKYKKYQDKQWLLPTAYLDISFSSLIRLNYSSCSHSTANTHSNKTVATIY